MSLDLDAWAGLDWLFSSLFGLVGITPNPLVLQLLGALVLALAIVMLVLTIVPGFVWGMRKIFADIGSRHGPTRVGPFGLLQTLADGVKMMAKETITPTRADRFGFKLAPYLAMVPVLIAFAPLPWSGGIILGNIGAGILFILAIGAISPLAEVLAGWSSNNKYSMYGGLRAAAMDVSYEIPMVISALAVVLLAGTLNTQGIVAAQQPWWFFILQPLGVVIFFVSAVAKIGVIPLDLPEAESELVAGYMTEYTGMEYGVFMLTLFANIFLMSAVTTTLFFGGWSLFPPWALAGIVLAFAAILLTRQPATTVNIAPPALLGVFVGVLLTYLGNPFAGAGAGLLSFAWGPGVAQHFAGLTQGPAAFVPVFLATWEFLLGTAVIAAFVSFVVTKADRGTNGDAMAFPMICLAAVALPLLLALPLIPFMYVGLSGGLVHLLVQSVLMLILPILPLVVLGVATLLLVVAAGGAYKSLADPVLTAAVVLLPGLFAVTMLVPIGSFLLKSVFFSFLVFWLWFTLPRVRVDQFLKIGWKTMFPLSLLTLVLAGVEAWFLRGGTL